jgi:hypothetical protein
MAERNTTEQPLFKMAAKEETDFFVAQYYDAWKA